MILPQCSQIKPLSFFEKRFVSISSLRPAGRGCFFVSGMFLFRVAGAYGHCRVWVLPFMDAAMHGSAAMSSAHISAASIIHNLPAVVNYGVNICHGISRTAPPIREKARLLRNEFLNSPLNSIVDR